MIGALDPKPLSSDPFDPTNERFTEMANLNKETLGEGKGESIENQILDLFAGRRDNTRPDSLSPEMNQAMVEGITGVPSEVFAGEGEGEGEGANTLPPSKPAVRGPDWDRFIAGATAGGGATSTSGALRGFAQGTQAYDQLRFGQVAALREIDANLQTALLRYQQSLDTAEFNGLVDQMIEWRNSASYRNFEQKMNMLPDGPAKQALIKAQIVNEARMMNDAVRSGLGRGTGLGQGVTASGIAQIQSTPYSS